MDRNSRPSNGHGRVLTDIGTLRRVIVHTPGPEIYKVLNALSGGHPMLTSTILRGTAIEQHRAFVELLEDAGVEVLQMEALLDDAIVHASAAGVLETWLRGAAPRLVPHAVDASGAMLLGAVDRFAYHTEPDGTFRPLTAPVKSILFTRDIAVMTPRGVVVCNFMNPGRSFETSLIRLAFDYAPQLQKYPVAFDAHEHGVCLQGGDVIVVDDDTLFIGVGNLTEEAAAVKLARILEMDVVAVQLPTGGEDAGAEMYESWHGLRSLFLHLDSVFNMVDRHRAIAVPLLLEAEYARRDPLSRIASGLARNSGVSSADVDELLENLEKTGRVRKFCAGSGEEATLPDGIKLVDYVEDAGWDVVRVGGPADEGDLAHFLERTLRELHFQAANVVATAPGRVVAYGENEYTIAALRASGVEVSPFAAYELARWGGGPHCLSLPLERDA
jgi:arginine deiminase